MEANYGEFDQNLGVVWLDLKEIPRNQRVKRTFLFNEVQLLPMITFALDLYCNAILEL